MNNDILMRIPGVGEFDKDGIVIRARPMMFLIEPLTRLNRTQFRWERHLNQIANLRERRSKRNAATKLMFDSWA